MRLITPDDFLDTYSKISQRGAAFFLSKFTFNKNSRAISAFDESYSETSNWWIIPAVQRRWSKMICGDENVEYKDYFMKKYFENKSDLKLLSLGSGECAHEIELGAYANFSEITCVDINQANLDLGKKNANERGLKNMKFLNADVNKDKLPQEYYDIVFFSHSLHHFEEIEKLLEQKVKPCLRPGGLLIIHEFVGATRHQFPKKQIQAVNRAIPLIAKKYRTRYKTNLSKNSYSGPGLLRMIVADPSECVDSASILPAIYKNFSVVEEKPYGGNILVGALKEIAHHFVQENPEKKKILQDLFRFEDDFLKENQSDYVFGIYEKPI